MKDATGLKLEIGDIIVYCFNKQSHVAVVDLIKKKIVHASLVSNIGKKFWN